MTALNFILAEDQVIISMDSLSSNENANPFKYTTKIFPLPHINTVVCGTGSLQLVLKWFCYIQEKVLAENINVINREAPEALPILEKETGHEVDSTIYHFGIDSHSKKFVGYAFRKNNNYRIEKLDNGIGVRPPDAVLEKISNNQYSANDLPELFIKIMKDQREFDNSGEDKVGIGGEIHMLIMTENKQLMWTSYRFDDFEAMYDEMLNHCDKKI